MKKLLLTLGALSAVAMPIAAVVSCGSGSKPGVTPPAKGTPGITGGQGGSDGSGAGGSAGTVGQTGGPIVQKEGIFTIGSKINTLDRSDASIQTDVVINKDGHILTWDPFVPIRTTKSQSRVPGSQMPKPITVFAEPFTRTTSPGAMDVTGWKPGQTYGVAKTEDEIKTGLAAATVPQTSVAPIATSDFLHLSEILTNHLLVLSDLDTFDKIKTESVDTSKDLINEIMQKIGIDNLAQCGINTVKDYITIQSDTGVMLNQSIKILTLKNVIFVLNGNDKYLPLDIRILIK